MGQLLINLSFLSSKPTGHTVYAKNVLPDLAALDPILLSGQSLSDYRCHKISNQLTPDQGIKGHLARLLWTQFRLPQLYQKFKASLLFSPIPEAPLFGKHLFGKHRFVVTLHDLIPLRFGQRSSPLSLYHQYYVPQVLAQAEHILCDSKSTADDAINLLKIPAKKLTVIPLAYDRSHFRFLDLPTQNYFLYVGRHDFYKNVQRSILAFSQLPQDYEFWIAGSRDARYTPTLEAQITELGLTKRVKFLDYISYSELPRLINQAIALVFPSLWEGFGLPVLEAMACGTPVITSNVSSLPEVAGDAAILVDPHNDRAIANAMIAIATDAKQHEQLRQKGLDRVQHFSWEKTAATTAAILQHYL